MVKRVICFALFVTVILFLITGCYFSSFSEEKANEAALSYLRDKYSEEFVAKEGGIETDSMYFGNNWYALTVVKKSEENEEPHREYTVCISTDRKYTVLGDTVILDYYKDLYEEYINSKISKEMMDIPFVLFVRSDLMTDRLGVDSQMAIPIDQNDESVVASRSKCVINIYISESTDNKQIPKVIKRIKSSLTDNDYLRAYLVIVKDENLRSLSAAEDKYLEDSIKDYYSTGKVYKVE